MPLWRSNPTQDDPVVVPKPPSRKRDRLRSLAEGTLFAKPGNLVDRKGQRVGSGHHYDRHTVLGSRLSRPRSKESDEACVIEAETVQESSALSNQIGTSRSLWDQAYEALREGNEDERLRLERYEVLLTVKLRAGHDETAIKDMIHSLEADASMPKTNYIHTTSASRRSQMNEILEIGARDMEERRLRLYIGGNQIMVGDQMAKVASFVKWSEGWIGTAAQVHPEASMAWAAISLALPLLTNPVTAKDDHADGYTKTTALTEYYARMEALYLPSHPGHKSSVDHPSVYTLRKEVEDGIRDLYKSILDFQIRSVLRFYRNRFKNFCMDVVQRDDWAYLTEVIDTCHVRVKGLVQEKRMAQTLVSAEAFQAEWKKAQDIQRNWLEHFSQASLAIKEHLEAFTATQLAHNQQQQQDTREIKGMMKTIVDDKTRDRIIGLLAALDGQIPQGTRPDDVMARTPDRLPNTANWVLASECYQEWLHSPSGLLFISCPPGCGKSVLSKHIIDESLPKSREADICYFFFDQHTVAQALCSILHQLFSTGDCDGLALPMLTLFEKQPSILTNRGKLWKVLRGVLGSRSRGVSIILDAIDQCGEHDVSHFLHERLEDGPIHISITARPLINLTSPFELSNRQTVFRIRGEEEEAMAVIAEEAQLVIRCEIAKLPWPTKSRMLLEQRMMQVTNPTYLWVRLLLDHVRQSTGQGFYPDPRNIEKLVSQLPDTAQALYDSIFNATTDPIRLRTAMGMIIAAQRPLTLREMNLAMSIRSETPTLRETEDDILEDDYFAAHLRQWCSLFIVIHEKRVFLLHETARDFLTAATGDSPPGASTWKGSIPTHQAHLTLAENCMRSLMLKDLWDEDGESLLVDANGLPQECLQERGNLSLGVKSDHPRLSFIVYAALQWAHHVREAREVPHQLQSVYEQLCDPSTQVCKPWLALCKYQETDAIPDAEYLDSIGVKALMGHYMQVKSDMEADSTLLQSPLGRGGTEMTMPALFTAVMGKRADLVIWLLENGADPNDTWGPHTPLVQLIDDKDPRMLDLVPLFLQKGARTGLVNLEGFNDRSPVYMASERGLSNIVDMILAHEESTGSESTASLVCFGGDTPLHAARDEQCTFSLLKHDADPFVRDNCDQLPMSAVRPIECKKAIVRSCQDRGIPPSKLLPMLREALDYAQTASEVALYFQSGVSPGMPNASGDLPLFSIKILQFDGKQRQAEVLEELLQYCDPETKNDKGETALLHHISSGSTVVARSLLARNIDLFARDNAGGTVLHHCMSRLGNINLRSKSAYELIETIIGKLLLHPEILHARTLKGCTALHVACENSGLTQARMLLDHGLDIEAADHTGRTALLVVPPREHDRSDFFKLMCKYRANMQARDNRGRTVLHLTFTGNYWIDPEYIGSVLDAVPDINSPDCEGLTPLMYCVKWMTPRPHVRLDLMLERGADCSIRDELGRTVLHHINPGCKWTVELIEALIQKGADIHARTTEDETALHTIMVPTGKPTPQTMWPWSQPLVASVLIRQGAQVDARRRDRKTPLHLACLNRCHNTAKVLLQAGADLSAVDADGNTPLDMVHGEKRRQRFARLFLETNVMEGPFEGPLTEPLDDDDS